MASGPLLMLVVVERAVRIMRYASDGVALTEPEKLPRKVWVESVLPDGRRVRIIRVIALEVGVGIGVSRCHTGPGHQSGPKKQDRCHCQARCESLHNNVPSLNLHLFLAPPVTFTAILAVLLEPKCVTT